MCELNPSFSKISGVQYPRYGTPINLSLTYNRLFSKKKYHTNSLCLNRLLTIFLTFCRSLVFLLANIIFRTLSLSKMCLDSMPNFSTVVYRPSDGSSAGGVTRSPFFPILRWLFYFKDRYYACIGASFRDPTFR